MAPLLRRRLSSNEKEIKIAELYLILHRQILFNIHQYIKKNRIEKIKYQEDFLVIPKTQMFQKNLKLKKILKLK